MSTPTEVVAENVVGEGTSKALAVVTDADILEQITLCDGHIPMVVKRLGITRDRVVQAIANNYAMASQAMRAMFLVKTADLLDDVQVAMGDRVSEFKPDDLGKLYGQISGQFLELTKQPEKQQAPFNINLLLGKLPTAVRGNVESLVNMDDEEWARIAAARVVGDDDEEAA